ncbi:MAG TPA: hypothetical protein VNW95_03145 [Mucilaginibacter sp.]|nr:hypothetical protein [Mucilaginibacter sp.]
MSKMQIECPVCGSQYILTSQRIEKIDKGTIYCYVCNNTLFAYNGCVSYYPYLLTKKQNHLQPNFPFNDLGTDFLSEG